MSEENEDKQRNLNSFLTGQVSNNFKKINSLGRITGRDFLPNSLTKELDDLQKINAFGSVFDELNLNTSALSRSLSAFDNIDFSRIAKNNQFLASKLVNSQEKLIGNLGFNSVQQLSKIAESLPKSSIEHFSNTLLRSIPDIEKINDTFSQELANQEIKEINLEDDPYNQLLNYFEEKISSLPKGTVNAQGIKSKVDRILSLLLVILAFTNYLNSRETSEQNEMMIEQQNQTNEYLESLENFTEQIYPKVESLIDKEEKEKLLIVKKEATLRVKPDSKSDSLTNVFPNQLLDIKGEVKRWYYIEFFDHREAIPKMGWIYKGNVAEYSKPN